MNWPLSPCLFSSTSCITLAVIAYLTQLETWKHEAEESQYSRNIRTHKADSPRNDMGKKESKEETPEI